MKNLYQSIAFIVIVAISSCSSSRNNTQGEYPQSYSHSNSQPGAITYQQFYNELSPYGNWINYPGYGYVWMPGVQGFRPYYSSGRWAYTNYGWTWVSDYSWGWAPFHYGRWINERGYGWMWIPGNEWAPAWVAWRGGGDYYGWAPLGPGMNINVSMGSIPYNNWAFVPHQYINSPRINNYYAHPSQNVTIINHTTIINNTTVINNGSAGPAYNQGPPVREVESVTGAPVRRLNMVESNKAGNSQITNNSVNIYRPRIQQQASNATNLRPSRVTDISEIERNNNSNNNPPVREFPQDQTPQVNRNEPPVNTGRPSVAPERNAAPVRTSPDQNPAKLNVPPVRTLPSQNPPAALERNGQSQNNVSSTEVPIRSQQIEYERRAKATLERNNPPVNKNSHKVPERHVENHKNTTTQTRKAEVSNKEIHHKSVNEKPEQVKR